MGTIRSTMHTSARRHVAAAAMSAAALAHHVDVADDDTTDTLAPKPDPAAIPTGRKEPPIEKPSDTRRRSLVILSFWLIVLCLGLPIWWDTTTIPRASLPMADMMDWADGKV